MRLNRAWPHKANHLSPAEGPIHLGSHLRVRRARGRASAGNPRTNCVADDRHRRPLADRGSPGRTHGTAVTNPRIRVCSTVVLTALPPAPRTRSILPQPVPDNGIAHPRPTSLTTNIRIHARKLDLEPDLHLLPRHPRSLLRSVEQAHRSALAHHVHRHARLGSPVLINGTWYKTDHANDAGAIPNVCLRVSDA